MATFKDQNWTTREQTLGDPAETAFELWAGRNNVPNVRYGLCRPPIDMRRLAPMVRYTPDYLAETRFIEVQGCGKDASFKFKHDKLEALKAWHSIMPVYVWLWNQPDNESVLVEINELLALCVGYDGTYREDGVFDGTKPYASVSWSRLVKK